jgi:hypothetical protein
VTDFAISGGRISAYSAKPFGAQFVGSRATFCLDSDLIAGLDSNVLAIPNLPITVLTNSPVKVDETFFGMHVQKRTNDGLPGVTVKIVRSHDLQSGTGQWKFIETSDNVWNWSNIDAWVNAHHSAGRELVFVLFGTPTWASARPAEVGAYGANYSGLCAEPGDMTKWDRFCTQVATRYKGKIQYYEVWNEPNLNNNGTTTSGSNFFFSGTFAKLSEMVRRANQAIKAVDPTAKIICPAVQGWQATSGTSDSYFAGMMSAEDGATGTMKDWVDIVGVHLYLPSPNKVQDLAGVIDRVKASMAAASVSGKEIWDTESAPIGPDMIDLTDEKAQAIIARSMITMAAKGVARTFYYQYDHGTMGYMGRPQVASYRESIAKLLRGGWIVNAHRFTDGRVAFATESGLTII